MDAQNSVRTYVPQNIVGNSFVEILDIDLVPGSAGTLTHNGKVVYFSEPGRKVIRKVVLQ